MFGKLEILKRPIKIIDQKIIEHKRKIKIVPDYLPICKYTRPGVKNYPAEAVVIHWFENPGQTAKQCRRWLIGQCNPEQLRIWGVKEPRSGSAHYGICLDGSVYAWIPTDEVAYSVGGPMTPLARRIFGSKMNYKTINIELPHPDWSGKPTEKTYKSAVKLSAFELRKNRLPIDRLFYHTELTGKGIEEGRPCHKYFHDNPGQWDDFKNNALKLL